MNTWKVILVTLVIFSTGAITGGLIARKATRTSTPPARDSESVDRRDDSFRPERWHRRGLIERMQDELALTPAQAQQIEAILTESQERMRELWKEMSPRMREEFDTAKEEIKQLLTPEQQEAFDAVMDRRRGSKRDEGKPRGDDWDKPRDPPPPPPGP